MRKQNRKYDASFPPAALVNDFTQEDWEKAPLAFRLEKVRRLSEMEQGIAIWKDRTVGRAKYDTDGFYGLELARQQLYALEHQNGPASEIEQRKQRIAELDIKLAPDQEELQLAADLKEFVDYARAEHGLTLAQWIKQCLEIEALFRNDVIGGIFTVCDKLKLDPIRLLRDVLAGPNAHQPSYRT